MREADIKKGLDGLFYKYNPLVDDFFVVYVDGDFIPYYESSGGKNNNSQLTVKGLFRRADGEIVDQRLRNRRK